MIQKLNYSIQKIWAKWESGLTAVRLKRESGLTAVRLKWEPPVTHKLHGNKQARTQTGCICCIEVDPFPGWFHFSSGFVNPKGVLFWDGVMKPLGVSFWGMVLF